MLRRTRGEVGPSERERSSDRRRLLRAAAVAVVLGAVCGALGWTWGDRQAETHAATATILLNPLQGNPFSPDARGDDLVNLETEAQLVTSDVVLEQLDAELGDESVTSSDVSVTVPTNTQLLAITVTRPTEEAAVEAAQALAQGYLAHRRARTEGALAGQRRNIDTQVKQQVDERAALLERFDALPAGAPGGTLLTQQILATVTRIGDLRAQLGEVGSVSLDPGQVVTPAEPDGAGPVPAGPVVPGVLGLLAGGALGAFVALRAGRGRRVRTGADLAGLPVPVWGTVPADGERQPAAAARLRAAVRAAHPGSPMTVLACRVAATPSATAPLVAAPALARSLAASRCRTVLVDVSGHEDPSDDPAGPRGLADLLRQDARLPAALSWSGHLGAVGHGRSPVELDDLAASSAMGALLQALVERTDDGARTAAEVVVLCAGSPASPRTQALVASADLVLVEVPSGRTALRGVEEALADLAGAGAVHVGVVLVGPPARPARARQGQAVRDPAARLAAMTTSPGHRAVQALRRVLVRVLGRVLGRADLRGARE